MGIAWQAAKWLTWLSLSGVRYGRVVTLGRQNLYMPLEEIHELMGKFGLGPEVYGPHLSEKPQYAEPLFRTLGAESVDSIDASDYEQATIIHDMNEAVGSELWGRFDTVYDGGTLEHVFNFAEAMRSSMRMVRVGGSIIFHQCFNNMVGHGFYCFGPEVFYRALSPENGFEVRNVRIIERYPRSPWHELTDPDVHRSRVRLVSWGQEVEILVHAVRVREAPIFARWPQQSDYVAAWTEGAPSQGSPVENPEQVRLGVRSSGVLGRLQGAVMRPLRKRALNSATLGKLGKFWLNSRNFSLGAQRTIFPINDPFMGGSAAVNGPTVVVRSVAVHDAPTSAEAESSLLGSRL